MNTLCFILYATTYIYTLNCCITLPACVKSARPIEADPGSGSGSDWWTDGSSCRTLASHSSTEPDMRRENVENGSWPPGGWV